MITERHVVEGDETSQRVAINTVHAALLSIWRLAKGAPPGRIYNVVIPLLVAD
jgi:hypothetical protein